MRKSILFLVGFTILATIMAIYFFESYHFENPIFQTQISGRRIEVLERSTLRNIISPHVDKKKILRIGKKEFLNLNGLGLGFEELKSLQSIIFVTEESGELFIHIFSLEREIDTKIPARAAPEFGILLGANGANRDKATVLNSNAILISTEGFSFIDQKSLTNEYLVDLEKKAIVPLARTN